MDSEKKARLEEIKAKYIDLCLGGIEEHPEDWPLLPLDPTDIDFLIDIICLLTKENKNLERAAKCSHEMDQELWSEIKAPLCKTHKKYCVVHCYAWLIKEMTRLREIEKQYIAERVC